MPSKAMGIDIFDTDAEQERDATVKSAAEQEARWEIEDLKWLMKSKRGRRVMWRLLANAGVYRTSHVPGDPFSTAFNEGNRSGGLRLMALLTGHIGEDYGTMVKERTDV